MTQYQQARPSPPVSGWAVGGVTFAGTLMLLLGLFQSISGLAAIIDGDFFVVSERYAFDLDVNAWGWIHLAIGVILVFAGVSALRRRAFGGVVAIILAILSAVANFFFIPYYPFWSLLMIGLAVWVIWALTRPGAVRA